MSTIRRLTVVIEREGEGYVALCPEFDIASQGGTERTVDAPEIDRRFQSEVFIAQVMVPVG
ncbi:MAG: type II toxin-antitoxin system HicB family antitoxin [Acidobacteria bacterium]|nr:type II toxin-antitoxin system HicB family antitoxin [Acidobacteriota bacterium]